MIRVNQGAAHEFISSVSEGFSLWTHQLKNHIRETPPEQIQLRNVYVLNPSCSAA